MGLFSKKNKQQAFVFYCKSKPCACGSINWMQLGETMRQVGCTVPSENIVVFQPDWNKTVYSGTKVSGTEGDDIVEKVKAAAAKKGFAYRGETIKTFDFAPGTSFGSMGLFIVWYQTV